MTVGNVRNAQKIKKAVNVKGKVVYDCHEVYWFVRSICHENIQLLILASVDHQEGNIGWHQEDWQRSDEESRGKTRR